MNRMNLNNLTASSYHDGSSVESQSTPSDGSKRFGSFGSIILSFTKKSTASDRVVPSTTKLLLPTSRGFSNHASIRLKKDRKKRRKRWHISTKRKVASFKPQKRYHRLIGGKDASLDFFTESTLFTIPEHGAGSCPMRYITKTEHGTKRAWSIHEHHFRPQHRRASVVLSGCEPSDRDALRSKVGI